MTAHHPQAPFVNPTLTNLNEVLINIETESALSSQRKRNLKSSIKTFCKITHRAPKDVVLHPAFIRPLLERLHPAQTTLTKSRIANVRSDLSFLLKRYGPHKGTAYLVPLQGDWLKLWNLPVSGPAKYDLRSVSRLMRYCQEMDISPHQINDQTARSFLKALINESLAKNPEKRWKTILYAWNKLVERVAEWPQVRLEIPKSNNHFTFPLKQFPATFQNEVNSQEKIWEGQFLLEDDGPDKPLSSATIKKRLVQIRELASALVLEGVPIEQITSLSVLTEPDAAKKILRFYLGRSNNKTNVRIHGLAVMLKTLGKYAVGLASDKQDTLTLLCKKLDPKVNGMTEKNRTKLRAFDDPDNVRLILNLPDRLAQRARQKLTCLRQDALLIQKALTIQILLMAPMRLKNLSELNIAQNLLRSNHSNGSVHLVIPGQQVKNGEPLDYPLPTPCIKLLELYLSDFRPALCEPGNPWLFPGKAMGSHKSGHTLGQQIKTIILEETGLDVNPHLFRHLSAKLFLDQHPGQYETVRRHLGHRSIDTTIKAYSGMETAAASRHFDQTILNLQHQLNLKVK